VSHQARPGKWNELSPYNEAYLVEAYEAYRLDPLSVSQDLRDAFAILGPPGPALQLEAARLQATAIDARKAAAAAALARAIRAYGHRAAQLDPLGSEPPGDPALDPASYGLTEADLEYIPAEVVGGPIGEGSPNALTALRALRQRYHGTIGYEFEHLGSSEERSWWEWVVETDQFRPPKDPIDELRLLDRLTEVGALERFLHRAFPGHIRFSLEGLGMMVPMLDEILGAAAESGTKSVILGMAHRGRLNVLAHILAKPYEQIIAEFMGIYQPPGVSHTGSSDLGWTGDVKYHLGARKAYPGGREVEMLVHLAPNPSHLEWVNPVVIGIARASAERRDKAGPPKRYPEECLSILIHGDASFPGQGIVAETLNLYRLPGYSVGGTIHIIANNQIGFTTDPTSSRSTAYASDLARGFDIPVIHVNADDVEACIAVARMAHAYRERFQKDVLIDLIGYRRWGHNETDEPSFTQPLLYKRIAEHPTVRELWVRELSQRGLITPEEAESRLQQAIEHLHSIRRKLAQEISPTPRMFPAGLDAGAEEVSGTKPSPLPRVETAVSLDILSRLNEEITRVPEGFHLHPKLEKPFARRREALSARGALEDSPVIDWAHAEVLSLASILAEGTPVRLTGQDTARGTFSQRHLVLHDFHTGATHVPLQAMASARASFEVWDSPLSEAAVLGFEYGFSVQAQDALVIWEAQYGDFVNVAQVIVDQFIVSGRSKWGQKSGLVLLLPHGYEGQGPEHSSARVERFLQMAAENNMIIANCTTAAQYFHILRRQARLIGQGEARPLILLTPKSLLRHPLAQSTVKELAEGRFQPVIPDASALAHPYLVRRLILCSGKIYVDLASTGRLPGGPQGDQRLAVIRLEQLYPFPHEELLEAVAPYEQIEEVLWVQEEPRNMGAWSYVAPKLRDLVGTEVPIRYVGRPVMASPAEGTQEWHQATQERIIADALDLSTLPSLLGRQTAEQIPSE
jgi:2-oxoglutarate dehydrogenase E1 component